MDIYSVGGYIVAWCTKCRLELGHTIIAMVENNPRRVKCNTCGGEHNFRGRPAERTGTGPKKGRRTKQGEKNYDKYLSILTDSDFSNARKYSINENFEKEDIINHTKFGIGIVLSVMRDDKIEVLFKDGPRLLVQNR